MVVFVKKKTMAQQDEQQQQQQQQETTTALSRQANAFSKLRRCKKFDLILADPPWKYGAWPKRGNADNHYPTMPGEDIAAMPVHELADPNGCVLLMWVTGPKMEEALGVMKSWGFKYNGVFCNWVKTTIDGQKLAISCGHYTRSGSEFVLMGVRGAKTSHLRAGGRKDVRQVLMAPRTRHSAKPREVHRMARDIFPGAKRRLELFARRKAPGWRVWGNEV